MKLYIFACDYYKFPTAEFECQQLYQKRFYLTEIKLCKVVNTKRYYGI